MRGVLGLPPHLRLFQLAAWDDDCYPPYRDHVDQCEDCDRIKANVHYGDHDQYDRDQC